jgi:hypothetical protein
MVALCHNKDTSQCFLGSTTSGKGDLPIFATIATSIELLLPGVLTYGKDCSGRNAPVQRGTIMSIGETDTNLTEILQQDLTPLHLRGLVRREAGHLHILLSRPERIPAHYPKLVDRIQEQLQTQKLLGGIDAITYYGRVAGKTEFEWTTTSKLDTYHIITRALQRDFSLLKIRVFVKQEHRHLQVQLIRPQHITVNYPALLRLIRTSLRSLHLEEVEALKVCGRVSGETHWEWQVTSKLEAEDVRDRDGTTIHMPDAESPRVIRPTSPPLPLLPQRSQRQQLVWLSVGGGLLLGLILFLVL